MKNKQTLVNYSDLRIQFQAKIWLNSFTNHQRISFLETRLVTTLFKRMRLMTNLKILTLITSKPSDPKTIIFLQKRREHLNWFKGTQGHELCSGYFLSLIFLS